MTVALLVVAALVVLVVVVVLARRRRRPDAVDSFRRQIDALSPEARRPTVDQVRSVEEQERRPEPRPGGVDATDGDDGPGDGEGPSDGATGAGGAGGADDGT